MLVRTLRCAAAAGVLFVSASNISCTPQQRTPGAVTAITVDVSKVACVFANAVLSDAAIRKVCGILDNVEWQNIQPYLAEERKAIMREHAMMGAGKCGAQK